VSAASAVYLLGGLGVIRFVEGDKGIVFDQVPVDMVADEMIVGAATWANKRKFTVILFDKRKIIFKNLGCSYNEFSEKSFKRRRRF